MENGDLWEFVGNISKVRQTTIRSNVHYLKLDKISHTQKNIRSTKKAIFVLFDKIQLDKNMKIRTTKPSILTSNWILMEYCIRTRESEYPRSCHIFFRMSICLKFISCEYQNRGISQDRVILPQNLTFCFAGLNKNI